VGYKVCKLQNTSDWSGDTPDIVITIDSPEWEQAYINWLNGKNPTQSKHWKRGVFATTKKVIGDRSYE
jgi:hypothetical protein